MGFQSAATSGGVMTTSSFNDPQRVAVIVAGGATYRDWTRVEVERDVDTLAFSTANFEAVEPSAMRSGREGPILLPQLMPGADCTIKLGGRLALTGLINRRVVH